MLSLVYFCEVSLVSLWRSDLDSELTMFRDGPLYIRRSWGCVENSKQCCKYVRTPDDFVDMTPLDTRDQIASASERVAEGERERMVAV